MRAPDPQRDSPSTSRLEKSEASTIPRSAAASPRWRRTDWVLGALVALVLAAVAIPGVRTRPEHAIEVASVERVGDLMRIARDQAVATGDEHFVFLEALPRDASGASVLFFRDLDGDAVPSEIEVIGRVPLEPAEWGSAAAREPAIGDAGTGLTGPWSFVARSRPASIDLDAIDPVAAGDEVASEAGAGPAVKSNVIEVAGSRGLVFDAAGVPHDISQAGLRGVAGSGAGSLYLRTATQDYAIVLSPWGDVDVQVWHPQSASWRVAIAR